MQTRKKQPSQGKQEGNNHHNVKKEDATITGKNQLSKAKQGGSNYLKANMEEVVSITNGR